MMRQGNIRPSSLSIGRDTCRPFCALAVALLTAAVPVAAQPADNEPELKAPLLDWAVARQAYRQIEDWVKQEKAQSATDRSLRVSGLVGARVTLRYGGLTVGIGDAYVTSKPHEPVDLLAVSARATQQALDHFKQMRERTFKRGDEDNDAPDKLPTFNVTVGLQLAHALAPIRIDSEADSAAIYFQFAAGYHGLRMAKQGDGRTYAWIWPATALAANQLPNNQLQRLLSDADVPRDQLDSVVARLGRPDGKALHRFEVIHLVRPFRGQPITQLTRGNQLIPAGAVDMRTVQSMAQRLANHLVRRRLADGNLTGTYLPASDRFDPAKASVRDAAMVAFALGRRAAWLAGKDPDGLAYHNAKERMRPIVDHLRRQLAGNPPLEQDPEAAALLMLTLIESPHLGELRNDRDQLGRGLTELRTDNGWFVHPEEDKPLSSRGQATVTAALASLYEQTRQPKLAALIHKAQDALWAANLSTTDLVEAMPWMAVTLMRMRRLEQNADEAAIASYKARVEALRTLAANLRSKKLVRTSPKLGPVDVVGGYDLINETDAGAPTPDWRSAHVLALLAHQLRHETLMADTDANLLKFDCILTLRFLAQLMFDEPSCYYVRNRREVQDGVRFALWDNRLRVTPTATALLAITELQASLDAVTSEQDE